MQSKPQILIIHGGMTFKTQKDYLSYLKKREISLDQRARWSDEYLQKSLGPRFQIIRPRMPQRENARYNEWKIHFERHIPFLRNNVILIGSSLGGIFLAKYLSENTFPRTIAAVYLICPPFDNKLTGEDLAGGFTLKKNLSSLANSTKNLHLLFSKDDDVVPIAHAEKYRAALSNAEIIMYKSKNGHFKISTFPEIVRMIKADVKNNHLKK